MIEDHFKTPEEIVLLERWMSAPAEQKPKEVPAELADKLERLQRAHKWLLQHHSKRIVCEMMHTFYTDQGRKYSEHTARIDVNDTERLFVLLSPYTGPFVTSGMIDSLYQAYESARRAGNHNAAAKYAITLDKYIERHDRYIKEREEAMTDPIPVLAVFDLEEARVPYDPNIHLKVEAWKAERKRKLNPPSNLPEAEFTEEPPDNDD